MLRYLLSVSEGTIYRTRQGMVGVTDDYLRDAW